MSFKSITARMPRKDRPRPKRAKALQATQGKSTTGEEVIIRYREVVNTKPFYGRYHEYHVVLRRKVICRMDLREHAIRWATERGYKIKPD